MFRTLLLLLVGAVAVVLVLAFRQPDHYTVERRAVVSAPPDTVFALINDFHRWAVWSPWARLDPAMTLTINTPGAGTGATYEWKGNREVGSGRMAIRESLAPSTVTIDMHFLTPIDSRSIIEFQLEPANGGTSVIWTMRGDQTLLSRVMGVFSSMDAMVGPDFERGLAQLQTAVAPK